MKTFFLLLITIFTISCNSKKEIPSQNLKRVWMLTEFGTFNKEMLMKKKAYLDLTKPDNASAEMGCNKLGFPYVVKSNNEIEFRDGFATRMACENMQLEYEFSKALPKITNYSVAGHRLTLTNEKGDKMEFVAQDWD